MGVLKLALSDAIVTFMWVFCVSSLGALTKVVSSYLGVEGNTTLLVTTSLVFLLLLMFTTIGELMGGAGFNPTATALFYAAGHGKDTLFSMAIRFPAQAVGAIGGALAIKEFMHSEYKHMLGGPSLKVDVHTGAIAEGFLTFIMSLAVLLVVIRGPKNSFLKTWMLSMCTVTLVILGSSYTGPSMNPANAYGWAFVNNSHAKWEQFYVYWVFPLIGSVMAAWVFRILFAPRPKKEKKA